MRKYFNNSYNLTVLKVLLCGNEGNKIYDIPTHFYF